MARILKTLNHLFKKKCQDKQEERLVTQSSEPAESTDEDPRQQPVCLINPTNLLSEDPSMYAEDSNLPSVINTLTEDKYIQELKDSAEQLKQCGITSYENRGSDSYSQCRLKDYLTTVEMFVDNNFPALPRNSQPLTGESLDDAMTLICSTVIGLVPILEDSVLVSYLLDSYNRRLFGMLSLLMDRRSSVKDCFFLLQWVKKTYYGQDHKGCLITQNGVLSVSDPLLMADWLTYSKQKLLTLLQENILTTLNNILQYDKPNSVCDGSNEEALIQVQLDVIQCLNAPIQASKTVSHTLTNAVQRLCCDELHRFIQRYVNAQRANEADLLHRFRTIYTCRQLRSYALSIIDSNNNTDSTTLLMLENMETQSLSSVKEWFAKKAKDNLTKYFSKEDGHLQNMMVKMQNMLETLPKMEQGMETKQLIIKAAYYSVTRAYLQCLMQRKYKKLKKRWNDVEKKIMCDAELFHQIFAQQINAEYDEQKMVLLKMGEILKCRNVDSLKLLCSKLYITFPKESEEYISALLRWRGELSRRQIKKIIDVSRDAEDHIQNPDHIRSHHCMYWWPCFC